MVCVPNIEDITFHFFLQGLRERKPPLPDIECPSFPTSGKIVRCQPQPCPVEGPPPEGAAFLITALPAHRFYEVFASTGIFILLKHLEWIEYQNR